MTSVVRTLGVVRYSAANAWADFRATYTWWTWGFGWLGRMLAQVTFCAFVGVLLADPGQIRYLVIGNAIMVCVVETMSVVASSSWERAEGTLPLLSAAPARMGWVFFGRSLQWPISGALTALVSLFVLSPFFGVHWTPAHVLPLVGLVLLTTATTYAVGLFLSPFVLTASGARNIVSNSAYLLMMAICGVVVPVAYWPAWVGAVAQALPLTHTLAAVRALDAGVPAAEVLGQAGLALLCGAGWLIAALVAFAVLEERARHNDSFDFSL